MVVCGVVAEFNPFHNGHMYLLDRIRSELKPDAIVVVMSGDFVQRGEPAIQSKFERAKAAVQNGADLVIELPVYYSAASAGQFAHGAVKVLKSMGVVTHLAFGCETDDVDELQKAAQVLSVENDDYKNKVKEYLEEGSSYPAAYNGALYDLYPEFKGLFDDKPNNLLAREYLKEIILQKADLTPFAVQRRGVSHDGGINDNIASAAFIRNCLLNEDDITPITDTIPYSVLKSFAYGEYIDKTAFERFFSFAQYRIMTSSDEELKTVHGVSEGLENKLREALLMNTDMDSFIQSVKGKRYTYSRISRILTNIVLGISDDEYIEFDNKPAYIKVLSFNETGQNILKQLSENDEYLCISNVNKQDSDCCAKDIFASDIYNVIARKKLYSGSDKVNIPRKQG